VELADESDVCESNISSGFLPGVRRDDFGSSLSVALGSLFGSVLENGKNAGVSSSSSASSERPSLLVNLGGRRRSRLLRGSSASDEDSDEEEDSAASDSESDLEGGTFGVGDTDRRFSAAFGSLGLCCTICRLWIAVFVEDVRLIGGATTLVLDRYVWEFNIPIERLGVFE
jgi:hypothetical protein